MVILSALLTGLTLDEVPGCTFAACHELPHLRLMFYNVENLFDTLNDTLTDDEDFLPDGAMRWTFKRYHQKISCLYKTIVAAGVPDPPDIVAFCEVENRKVLDDLIYGTYLSKHEYRIVHEDSPDRGGIDVCLIYRSDRLKLLDYSYWIPDVIRSGEFRTRSILHTRFIFSGDTLHLIVNHWPSRRGGVLAGEDLRNLVSGMLKKKTDSLFREGACKMIITGDFNCSPGDDQIRSLTGSEGPQRLLINLSGQVSGEYRGTYRYQGIWEMIDQVIVSSRLLNCESGLFTDRKMLTVFSPGFLLWNDPKYPGESPFPTYRGYRYQGGFSDHLPVILDLGFRNRDRPE